MDRIVIVKVGSTFPALAEARGDFEHWILAGMEGDGQPATVVDAAGGASLPSYEGIGGVVVTGSHAKVTDHEAWSERTAEWLVGAVEKALPLLGICYGHQLLAYALGGEVGDNPRGRDFGLAEVRLTEAARDDALLSGFPPAMRLYVAHSQSVLRLPGGAVRLASSGLDPNQAFVAGKCAWGVQFHPEFDAEVVQTYIEHFADALTAEGINPSRLAAACGDTPHGSRILRRFAQIAGRAV